VLKIHTFGGCYLEREGIRLDTLSGQRKGLALLALLAAAGDRGMSRETLLAYLWPESDEERARTSLKQLVHSLRAQLQCPELLLPSAELRLNGAVVWSDVAAFRESIAHGDFQRAAALHSGLFLDGFYLKGSGEFDSWVETERTSLTHLAARAIETLAEQATTRGDPRAAIELWRRLANAEPLSARAAVGLMNALDSAGERAAALQHARVYELLVRNEVGGALDASVLDAVSRLQRGERAAGAQPTGPTIDRATPSVIERLPLPPRATGSVPRRRSSAGFLVAAGVLMVAGVAAYRAWPNGATNGASVPTTARTSVAVLPFANISGDVANEPFSDGLTDELIGTLGKIPGLKVSGRTSSFALKGRGLSVRAIADTLGVGAVIEGSVRREGSRLKVTVELVNTSDGAVIWSEKYDRELVDALGLQEEIAQSIVAALRVKLVVAQNTRGSATRPPLDPLAYELFLRGRFIWWARTNRDGTLEAAHYFEQAIARDSLFARAYAGLSDAHARLGIFGYGQPRDEFAKARAAAERALSLDSALADAHASLGHVMLVYDWDWAGAEHEFRRALALDPSYTFARLTLAICLWGQERFDEAIADLDAARVTDPLSPAIPQVLGRIYVSGRKPDLAIRSLKEALELNPGLDLSYQQLGHAYLQKKMYPEALDALRRAAALSGARDSAHLAYAYAVAGQRQEAGKILRTLLDTSRHRYVPPFHIAVAYAGLGDVDEAFRWLERSYEEHGSFMGAVKAETAFESLHDDPRWPSLLRRVRFLP